MGGPFRTMFDTAIKLFKARNDSALASQIAGEFAVDGAVEYASWPIRIAKFWMSIVLILLALVIILFLWLGSISHWTVAIPTLLFGGLAYLIVRIWRGIDAGIERVSEMAKVRINSQLGRFHKVED